MKLYIAGKMRGIKDFNKGAFYRAEERLRADGYDVYNPCRDDEENGIILISETGDIADLPGFSEKTLKEIISRDINNLLDCEGIFLLKGWETSLGAQAELAIAKWGGKIVFLEEVVFND